MYIWLPGLGRVAPTQGPNSAYLRRYHLTDRARSIVLNASLEEDPVRIPVLCRFVAWRKAAEYYPMSLKKTADLDPKKNYVFGFHPHGIISMSAFIAFATEGLQVSTTFPGEAPCLSNVSVTSYAAAFVQLFPQSCVLHSSCAHEGVMTCAGLTFHVLTLVQNFFTPFIRDVLLQHGMADCAKRTCMNILQK